MEMNEIAALQYAMEHGIIDLSYVQEQMDMARKEEMLCRHNHKVWQGKDGNWYTYLPDMRKGRVLKKRKSREDLEDVIISYWGRKEEEAKKIKNNPTLLAVFEEWNDRRLRLEKIAPATYERNRQVFRRHFKDVSGMRIQELTPEWLGDFLEEQIPEHKLSARAFSNLKSVTRGFLKRARKRKLINFSVEEVIQELDVSEREFHKKEWNLKSEVFDEEEMERTVSTLKGGKLEMADLGILLMFVTGLRVGELAALKWEDWDGCALQIRRTETRYRDADGVYRYEVKDNPKTRAGIRQAVLPPECRWIMKEIRRKNPFGEFIFEKNGRRVKTYSFRKRLYRVCEGAEVEKKSPHKIRKTYGSILMDNQVAEKNVIELMGHTDIQCTKNHYSRDRKSENKKAELLATIPEFRIAGITGK